MLYRRSVDGPETASILTRPDERRFLLRHHVLPTAVVLVEAVVGIASLEGVILGATAAVAAVALVLDRVTLRAPLQVRILVPVVVLRLLRISVTGNTGR